MLLKSVENIKSITLKLILESIYHIESTEIY